METVDENLDKLLTILVELNTSQGMKFSHDLALQKFGGGNIYFNDLLLILQDRHFVTIDETWRPYALSVHLAAVKFKENGGFVL